MLPLLLSADNGLDFTPFLASSDDVEISYAVVPAVSGSFTVRLGVINQGREIILDEETLGVTSAAELFTPIDRSLILPAQTLLNLNPGADSEFRFFLAIEHGTFSTRYEGPGAAGVRVVISDSVNLPPSGTVNHEATGRSVRFFGSYRDLDGDPAQDLTLRLEGPSGASNYNLLPYLSGTGWGQEREFSRSLFLQNGIYSYSLLVTNGHHSRQIGPFPLRVSEGSPHVSLMLSSSNAEVGELVSGTVTVTDVLGPVPDLEISLATDSRSTFRDSGGERTRKLVTDDNGVAQFTYEPLISGGHSLLAMEPSHEFALANLDIEGSLADWTTQWNWRIISGSDTEATYEVQVLVQYQGESIENGDYVFFSANHGNFEQEEDQVGDSSTAINRYTLSRAEADSGAEIITISLPQYGVEITHVTNLAVGSSASLLPVRTTSLFGDGDRSESFAVAFSRDGRYAARVVNESAVEIYRLDDLSLVRSVSPGGDDLTCLTFSPDGEKIATGDIDGNVSVITVATGAVLRRAKTNGHADILSLHWYDADRIAATTQGGTSSVSYTPQVLILSGSAVSIRSFSLSGVTNLEQIFRIQCHPMSQLCAASTWFGDSRWFLFTTAGTMITNRLHPDANLFWALAFNSAGDRLFVGGDNSNGAVLADLYDVSTAGANRIGQLLSSNSDFYAATFFSIGGEERLAVGGRQRLEVFAGDGGGALASSTEQGMGDEEGYYLIFLPEREELVAVRRLGQTFFSFASDVSGPAISLPTPPPLSYRETAILLEGTIEDPSGLDSAEFRTGTGPWQTLAVGSDDRFSFTVTDLPVGETLVDVRATDSRGNATQLTVPLVRRDDTSPPVVSQVRVSPASGVRGTRFTVSAQVTDADAGVASARALIRNPEGQIIANLPMTRGTGDSYSADFESQAAGAGLHTIDLEATDQSPHANRRAVTGAASFVVEEESPGSPPAAPSWLRVTAGSASEIDLLWDDNATDETGFRIERKEGDSGPWTLAGTPGTNAATFHDSGLASCVSYAYRVQAINSAGISGWSNEARTSTLGCIPPGPSSPPAAPSWLRVTAGPAGEIDLQWDDNATDETGFKVERKEGCCGPWTLLPSAPANATTYQSTGLNCGTVYAYRVWAFNAAGDSAKTNEAGTTTQVCP